MTEAVVGRLLLRVFEDLVGLVDFLEASLGRRVSRILVRMQLHGELAEGALQGLFIGVAGNAQNFIIVAFGHRWSRGQRIPDGASRPPAVYEDGSPTVFAGEPQLRKSGVSRSSCRH